MEMAVHGIKERAPCLVGVNVGRDGAVVPEAPVF